jgi:hypothetical protein
MSVLVLVQPIGRQEPHSWMQQLAQLQPMSVAMNIAGPIHMGFLWGSKKIAKKLGGHGPVWPTQRSIYGTV